MSESVHPHSIELINTGTELLLGQTLNTHTRTIGQALLDIGLQLTRQTTIPDGDILRSTLDEAIHRSRLIIITGGLGPTSDDFTRPIVSELLGKKLILHEPTLQHIRQRFQLRGLAITPTVENQAQIPEDSEVLPNPHGTAPGIYITHQHCGQDKHLFLLPGPPRELLPILEKEVIPRIDTICRPRPPQAHILIRTIGLGESHAQQLIEQPLREKFPHVEIGYCARTGEVDIRLILREDITKRDEARDTALKLLGDFVWHVGPGELENIVISRATTLATTIATAESCTGGLVAHRLTRVPGASAVFLGGAVVYSNQEKTRQLDVPAELIQNHGAVSAEVARAMLQGLLKKTQARHGVVTTGIAGPGGGTPEKPVGTCYIAATSLQGHTIKKFQLSRERDAFQYQAAQHALNLLRLSLA
jgi:nicotinamide-nucleotide amidase